MRNRQTKFQRMIKKHHNRKMERLQRRNQYIEMRMEADALKNKYKKKLQTSKLFLFLIFINCTCVEAFSMWITYKSIVLTSMVDFSALTALIGAIVGESLSYLIYNHKAAKENTKGGITYDIAMRDVGNTDAINNDVENNDGNNSVDDIEMVYLDDDDGQQYKNNNPCG